MTNISKLYCGRATPGDRLRYGTADDAQNRACIAPADVTRRRPVVVWNITKACNLNCVHCYTDSGAVKGQRELSTAQAKNVIDDLAGFNVPAILFSGGEPLMRPDIFELAAYAAARGPVAAVSTNGTLITGETAALLKDAGVSYVGISLDGIGRVNDDFRRTAGAFDRAVGGLRNCMKSGVRVGLRLTLTKVNFRQLDLLFDFVESEGVERVCFYHLVPTGRAMACEALTREETVSAVDTILERTVQLCGSDRQSEILTVDNHVDGVYLYLKLLERDPRRAAEVWNLLTWNGGGLCSSGVGIGCIDFDGIVHPDQFWHHYALGDVRERPFSRIWTDPYEPLLTGLRDRKYRLKGRCGACRFLDACGGGLRVRADLRFGDPWAPEPACYLSDTQIGLSQRKKVELAGRGELFDMPV